MDENMNTVNEATETTEGTSEESKSPVRTLIATGALLLGGLVYAGKKIFKRKKYHTVDHGRFEKD